MSCDDIPHRSKPRVVVGDLCLSVSYSDHTDDILVLNKVHGIDTIFKGTLYNEGTRASAVIEDASNPDDLEVKNKKYCLIWWIFIKIRPQIFCNNLTL